MTREQIHSRLYDLFDDIDVDEHPDITAILSAVLVSMSMDTTRVLANKLRPFVNRMIDRAIAVSPDIAQVIDREIAEMN